MSRQHFTTPQPPEWGGPKPSKRSFVDRVKQHPKLSAAAAGVAVLIVAAVLTGGTDQRPGAGPAGAPGPAPTASAAEPPAASSPATPPAALPPAEAAPTPAPVKAGTADLPDFVGMGLQSAQDRAQAAGFYLLTSHDALGRSRTQIDDRNWKVCAQNPAAGPQETGTKIDMGAVKLDEACPAADQGSATPKAGPTMPDFKGRAAASVRDALSRSTSLSTKDLLRGRAVIVESNWQVCTQDPAPGTALDGRPVALGVVKFEEKCP
ncbi:PASTA domain-containing protein [Kitasatospora phosalacinea]|uniref:PASTA domain-containing protein n=1 Tax=Kitasatospora phosalacinea TaxID=2065 RepID=UPI0009DF697E|nr:PASTA domain-containing protein [Kitasatospora phosalacinea]